MIFYRPKCTFEHKHTHIHTLSTCRCRLPGNIQSPSKQYFSSQTAESLRNTNHFIRTYNYYCLLLCVCAIYILYHYIIHIFMYGFHCYIVKIMQNLCTTLCHAQSANTINGDSINGYEFISKIFQNNVILRHVNCIPAGVIYQ